MKCCGKCRTFIDPFKTVAHSNSGRELEKIQRKNFCLLFHTEVSPVGKPCWHWGAVEKVEDE